MNLVQIWQDPTSAVLNLLFPPRCACCAQSGSWLCPGCRAGICFVQPPVCPVCGQAGTSLRLCRSCRQAPLRIDGIRAVGYLEGTLRTAVHRFKYSNLRPLAAPLGQLMADYFSQHRLPAEVIVPVPLHPHRLRERGYNQAELLAKQIAERVDLPVRPRSLVRVKNTAPQVGLVARQRRDNVGGAFHCPDAGLAGRRVLLVDDVCTTGATLEACSLALQLQGVRAVWGLVLARERSHQT